MTAQALRPLTIQSSERTRMNHVEDDTPSHCPRDDGPFLDAVAGMIAAGGEWLTSIG